MSEPEAATFVFTDLVGSTALATAVDRETADQLRETHFGLLRSAVAATGGAEVKGLGDGLMVRFTSPTRALACGVAMQQAIERHNRRSTAALAVRIGMATGEATEADGDYYGDAVVEAARLCAEADGGQILITELLQLLVGRHATQETVVLGPRSLKGLPAPVTVVEVHWEPAPEPAEGEVDQLPLPNQLLGDAGTSLFAFFGRASELAAVEMAVKAASAERRMRAVLIAGEPGVGKTWLAAQAARGAHERGLTVLFGASVEDLTIPYRPWLTALSHLVAHAGSDVVDRLTPVQTATLARLLPNEAHHLPGGESAAGDPDTERLLLMDAVVGLLEAATTTTPIVIVLDDLQWADVASLHLLRHLVAAGASLPVTVIATYRDSELARDAPLTALLADLRREPRATRLQLSGLGDHEVLELIQTAAGYQLDEAGVALAHAVHNETDGNPFFVTELLRHLAESGEIATRNDGRYSLTADFTELDLPGSIREVVGHRVARLGELPLRVLSLAAVVGQAFDIGVLAAVTDVAEDELLDLLDAAVAAALLTEDSSLPGRYRFAHTLIQHTLYQDLSLARRQRAHQRVAEALEAMPVDRLSGTGRSAALAHHWLAATQPAEATKALEYTERAADEALAALAPQDAAAWYQRALDVLDHQAAPDDVTRCRLLVGLARAQLQAGDPAQRETRRVAGELARVLGDRELLVMVAAVRNPGEETILAGDPDRLELLRFALEMVGEQDSTDRARLLAALSDEVDVREGRYRFALAKEAIVVAHRSGDDHALLEVLLNTNAALQLADTLEDQAQWSAEALELANRIGGLATQASAAANRMNYLGEAALIGEFDVMLPQLQRLAARTGLPWHQWTAGNFEAWRVLFDGRIDDSVAVAEAARDIGLAAELAPTMPSYGAHLMMVHVHRGTIGEILGLAEASAEQWAPMAHGYRANAIWGYCEAGQLDRAAPLFDREAAAGFDTPFDRVWLHTVGLWAESAAALGRADVAPQLYEWLLPYADRFFFSGSHDIGYIARPLGRLARLLDRPEVAEEHYRAALALHEQIGARYWLARTQLDLAELLAERGREAAEPEALATAALVAAQDHGYGGLANRARALLGSSG